VHYKFHYDDDDDDDDGGGEVSHKICKWHQQCTNEQCTNATLTPDDIYDFPKA